jgi:outer membrane biosynthesis protein TonB
MADEKPVQEPTGEESKKDTVRINLPPGLTGRPTGSSGAPTPAPRPATPKPPAAPEDEAKKETAVMGTPITAPKPKKDTSRVQVSAAKPAAPETPRPTVKLKRDDAPPAVPPTVAATAPSAGPAAAAPSSADSGLLVAAMVLSLAVLGYLAFVAMG